jgi:ATP synthase I chain
MRTVAVLTIVLIAALWIGAGWRAAMLLLSGALVSLASLFEFQRLVAVMNARLDNQQPPHSTSFVLAMFFLRLSVAVLVLYGSLKCFQTSGYVPILALAAGLCLAFVGLSIEAIKILIF